MIIKSEATSKAFLTTEENSSGLVAGAMSITTDSKAGNFVNGPVSLTTNLNNIRFGGVFKFNPLTASCIPSTLVTPISTFIIDVPFKQAAGLAKCAAIVMSTLGAIR